MRHTTTFLCVLLGAICIQSITAKPFSDPYGWDQSGSLLSPDVDAGFAVNPSTNFNDNLYIQLLRNNAFKDIFNKPYRADAVGNLLSCVTNSIAEKFQIDANSALNNFYGSVANIYPGSNVEVYASTAADSLSEVLRKFNRLSTYNSFNVANKVDNIFKRCADVSSSDTEDINDDTADGVNSNLRPGLYVVPGRGFGDDDVPGRGFGDEADDAPELGFGDGVNDVPGRGFGDEADDTPEQGFGDDGVDDVPGRGFGDGADDTPEPGYDGADYTPEPGYDGADDTPEPGYDGADDTPEPGFGDDGVDDAPDMVFGNGIDDAPDLVFGDEVDDVPGRGLGDGLDDYGLGTNPESGLARRPGAGVKLVPELEDGIGLLPELGSGVGLGSEEEAGVNDCLDVGSNVTATLDPGTTAVLFQQRLKKDLLRDRYFRSVLTDSIPTAVVSNIVSAIAQFLSKAFKLPRSYLLNLERDLTNSIKKDLASLDEYAEGISNNVVNLLAAANLLVPSAICVQIGMASKAITSGILNFLGTNKVAGVGLGINRNPYNSYFSILSGLEMLPYVGPDAVSRKYPPILKAIRATNFGAQFTQALTGNLISSNEFSSAFLLGIPAPIWRNVARCLGNSMAEAFGSVNPAFFMDVYANALLSVGELLSYKTYARVFSAATAKALYALGYFVSGNPNIQAAIAANAIIRTTGKRCILRYNKQFPTIKTNLGLPWMTPVAGVLPPQARVDIGANLGLGIGVDSEVDPGADVGPDDGVDASKTDLLAPVLSAIGGLLRRRRDLLDAQFAMGDASDTNSNDKAARKAGGKRSSGVNRKASANPAANDGSGVGADSQPDIGPNAGLGIEAGGDDASVGITSILNVLPQMLTKKLFASTAMYTAMSVVGPRKVANLIGQGIASQFGFPSAAVFSNTYDKSLANMAKSNFARSIKALARATAEALANAGVLSNGFTILSADQLSTAIVAKYSSLIATSLDTKEWNIGPRWTYIYDQDFIDPPLSRGYNYWKPNVFSSYVGYFDDNLDLDYGMANYVTLNIPANNGIPPARSKILLR